VLTQQFDDFGVALFLCKRQWGMPPRILNIDFSALGGSCKPKRLRWILKSAMSIWITACSYRKIMPVFDFHPRIEFIVWTLWAAAGPLA